MNQATQTVQPAIADIYPIPMRMSGAGKCPREIAYRSLGYDETDPPDRAAENRMDIGNAAEKLLVQHTIEDGWAVTNTVLEERGQLELVHPTLALIGHPDGICSHPEFTKNLRVPLEAKSMYAHRLEQVIDHGVFEIYPQYKAQIACYAFVLYSLGLTDHPYRAVFVCLDRDGQEMPPERCRWDAEYTASVFQRLRDIWAVVERGQLPERPYQPGDEHCRYCRFHTTCHGIPKPPERSREPVWINPDEDTEIALQYHSRVKQKLEAMSADNDGADIKAGPLTAGYFTPRDDLYEERKLAKYLTSEQLRECRRPAKPRFWIRAR